MVKRITVLYERIDKTNGIFLELISILPLLVYWWHNIFTPEQFHKWNIYYRNAYYITLIPLWIITIGVNTYFQNKHIFVFLYLFITFGLVTTCFTLFILLYNSLGCIFTIMPILCNEIIIETMYVCGFMLFILVPRVVLWLKLSSTLIRIRRKEMIIWKIENG